MSGRGCSCGPPITADVDFNLRTLVLFSWWGSDWGVCLDLSANVLARTGAPMALLEDRVQEQSVQLKVLGVEHAAS